jgi:uncharacterized membrane protein YedE/YeeE
MKGYLKRLLDSSDPTASIHNACYAGVVIVGVLFLAVGLVVGIVRHGQGLPFDWNTAFGILVAAVVGGKIFGKQDGSQ